MWLTILTGAEILQFQTDGEVFNTVGGNSNAPTEQIAELLPIITCDTYVGLGYQVVPDGSTDCTTTDPDFKVTNQTVEGGWFCANPLSEQIQSQDMFLIQVSVNEGASVGLNLRVAANERESFEFSTICGSRAIHPFTMDTVRTSTGAPTTTTSTSQTAPVTTTATLGLELTTTSSGTTTSPPTDPAAAIVVLVIFGVAIVVIIIAIIIHRRRQKMKKAVAAQSDFGNEIEMQGNQEGFEDVDVEAADDFL